MSDTVEHNVQVEEEENVFELKKRRGGLRGLPAH